MNGVGTTFVNRYDSSAVSWGVTYEFLVGYKHFLNDFVGLRYYGNVGVQHYKDEIFTSGKVSVGVVDYTLNADMLINFYNSESFTFGILAGFGVGEAYFDSPAIDAYKKRWGPSAQNPDHFAQPEYDDNMHKVKKNHLSASVSVGARFNIFQKIRNVGARVCSDRADGRRTCKVPISYLEHSIEFNAKFPLTTYYPTKPADMLGVRNALQGNIYNGSFARDGYEITNPYKFTLRYIIAF